MISFYWTTGSTLYFCLPGRAQQTMPCCSAPSCLPGPSSRIPILSEVRHANQKAAFPSVKVGNLCPKTQANLPGKLTHTTLKSDLSVLLPLAKKPIFIFCLKLWRILFLLSTFLEAQRSSFFLILLRKNRSQNQFHIPGAHQVTENLIAFFTTNQSVSSHHPDPTISPSLPPNLNRPGPKHKADFHWTASRAWEPWGSGAPS